MNPYRGNGILIGRARVISMWRWGPHGGSR